jgi:hypothetical protein
VPDVPDFIIHPPVLLKGGEAIASLDRAAAVVEEYLVTMPDDQSTSVLHHLQHAWTMKDGAEAADAFREWAADKRLLEKNTP